MPSSYIWLALVFFIFFFHLFISEYSRHEEGENCNPNFTRMVCWGWGWGGCLIHLQLYHLILHACKWCINNIDYLCPFANFRLNGFVVWFWVGDSKIQNHWKFAKLFRFIQQWGILSACCSMCGVWSMFLRAGLLIEILLWPPKPRVLIVWFETDQFERNSRKFTSMTPMKLCFTNKTICYTKCP